MRRMLALPLLLLASSAAAQRTPSLAVAADVGPAFPLGDFADDGAETGWGVGVSATVRLTRLLGVYGSYERTSFDVEGRGDDAWTDTGMGVGVRVWFPAAERARLHPWAQLGVGWHDLDRPLGAEFAELDTDGIRTLEGGAGVDVALVRQVLFLRPAIRYRTYSFEVDLGGETAETSASHLTLALGVMAVVPLR